MTLRSPAVAAVRGFLAATVTVGVVSLTRLAVGFVTAKYGAITLETAGVGVFAQGNQLYLLGITAGSLAMANGIIRTMSDARQHPDAEARRAAVMSTAFTIQAGVSLGLVAALVLTAGPLSGLVFGDQGSPDYLVATVVGIPFAVLASGYMGGIFFGEDRYDLYTKASSLAAVAGLGAFLLFTWRWGLTGAFWSIPVGGLLLFAFYVAYTRRIAPLRTVFRIRVDRLVARELLSYGAAMGLTSGAAALALLAVRAFLLEESGAAANGLYQVPIAMTALYTPFLTNGLWARLFPKVSAGGDSADSRDELNAALRLVVVGSALFVVAILATAEILIRLVYSADFEGAVRLLPVQLGGDVLYFAFVTLTAFSLARRRLRAYLLAWFLYAVLLLGLSVVFIAAWGPEGAALGYLCSSTLVGGVLLVRHLLRAGRADAMLTGRIVGLALAAVAGQAAVVQVGAPAAFRLIVPAVGVLVALLTIERSTLRQALGR